MKIKVLSPLHIGNGETKNKMSFFVESGNIYFIDENKLMYLVNKHNLSEEFIRWISEGGNSIDEFLKNHTNIKKELKQNSLYVLPTRGEIEGDINLHIKDSQNRFYIPGSSIKGAIRTALLYMVLKETTLSFKESLLYGVNNTDIKGILNVDKPKYVGIEIEKIVFRAGILKEKGIFYNDAKYDLLKFIHFSDAYPQEEAQFSVMPIRTFSAASQKWMNVKKFANNVEVIESGELKCEMDIDMKELLHLKRIKEEKEWIGLREKFERLFDFNLEELAPHNLSKYREQIISRLCTACNEFAKEKRKRDLELINNKQISVCKKCGTPVDKNNKCKKCNKICSRKEIQILNLERFSEKYPKDFQKGIGVVKLGFGTGWTGTTVGTFLDEDTLVKIRKKHELGKLKYEISCRFCSTILVPDFWGNKVIKNKKIQNILKKCPNCNRSLKKEDLVVTVKDVFLPFPKTIRIAFWFKDNTFYMFPLGWLSFAFA